MSTKPKYILYKNEIAKAKAIGDGWFEVELPSGLKVYAHWIATKANDGYFVVARLPHYLFSKRKG